MDTNKGAFYMHATNKGLQNFPALLAYSSHVEGLSQSTLDFDKTVLHTSPTSGHEHAKWSRPRDQGEKEVDTTCIEETQLYLSPKPLLLVIENQTSHGIKMNKGKTYVLSKLLSTKIVKHQTNRIQISPKATNLM